MSNIRPIVDPAMECKVLGCQRSVACAVITQLREENEKLRTALTQAQSDLQSIQNLAHVAVNRITLEMERR